MFEILPMLINYRILWIGNIIEMAGGDINSGELWSTLNNWHLWIKVVPNVWYSDALEYFFYHKCPWPGTNLRQCNQPNSNHQKNIVIAQIIAFGNFENYGSIKSMIKSILLFNYWNFPKIFLLAISIINCNLNINVFQFLGNGKVSKTMNWEVALKEFN